MIRTIFYLFAYLTLSPPLATIVDTGPQEVQTAITAPPSGVQQRLHSIFKADTHESTPFHSQPNRESKWRYKTLKAVKNVKCRKDVSFGKGGSCRIVDFWSQFEFQININGAVSGRSGYTPCLHCNYMDIGCTFARVGRRRRPTRANVH